MEKVGEKKGLKMLSGFILQHKWKYLSGIALLVVVNILQLLVPKITGNIVNLVVGKGISEHGLLGYSALVVLISMLVFIINYLSRLQIMGTSNLFDYIIRNKMFKHLLTLSMRFFSKKGVGDLMALSVNDVGAVRMAMGRGIILVANTMILIVSSIIIMGKTMNFGLTLVLFTPFPFLVFIMAKFGVLINKRFRRVQESFADLTRKAQENISGIRVVKAFSQEDNEAENFSRINESNYNINMKLVKVQGVFFPLISLLSSLSTFIVLFYGGMLVVDGSITIGDFVAYNSYIGVIVRPIGMIGMIINFIQRGKASMERIEELFRVEPDIRDSSESTWENANCRLKGRIEFKNLTFSYDEGQKPVLKNINLTVEPGKTVAIVGRVGYGKSTLVNLVLRLYDTNARGQLLIDGMDIADIPLKVLRDNIGYVPQDNFLFSQTIKENIGFSPREFSMEEIEKAAGISQVYDNIMEFPAKFDTMLGERGVNISGGQKQRVSIARALIKDPPILILDDCFSSVDTNTEKRILDGLRTIMKSRTCLIIAHRISTIMDADEIVVLDKGEILERGTHQQLVDKGGYYSRMYQRQLLEDKVVNA